MKRSYIQYLSVEVSESHKKWISTWVWNEVFPYLLYQDIFLLTKKANEGIVGISFLQFPVGAKSYNLFLWHGVTVLCSYIFWWTEKISKLKWFLGLNSQRQGSFYLNGSTTCWSNCSYNEHIIFLVSDINIYLALVYDFCL